MKFRLVRPILTPERHKPLLRVAQQLGIEQCLERMVKYTSHLSGCRAQLFQNRDIIQECNHGRYQHPVRRDEWFECAERMDVRRVQRKGNFLVRFPELYIINQNKTISLQSSSISPHSDNQSKWGKVGGRGGCLLLFRPLRHQFYPLSHQEEPSAPDANVVPSSA
jgi:hypothetical protein